MPSLTTTSPPADDGGPIPEPVLWRWVLDQRTDGRTPAGPAAAAASTVASSTRRLLDPVELVRQRPTVQLDAAPRRPAPPTDEAHDADGTAADDEAGQATAEYALVLLGAAAIALLVVSWATKTNVVGKLLDVIFSQLIGHATGGH